MFAQHAIACVLCELLCLELFNVFFQHENRFRYKFFDIVQFSRSCRRKPFDRRPLYFTTEVVFCQALFCKILKFFVSCRTWTSESSLGFRPDFSFVYWFFSIHFSAASRVILYRGAWRSSIIPYPGKIVNTFLQVFSAFCRRGEIRLILLYPMAEGVNFCIIM